MGIRRFPQKTEKGSVRAVLVVSTARALVYNYLPAPYLPAGSLPDRGVRCPTEPSKRQMEMETGGLIQTIEMEMGGGTPPGGVCVSEPPAEKISQSGPGRARPLAEGVADRSTTADYCRLRSARTVY